MRRGGRGLRGTALAGLVVLAIALALASWRALGGGNDAAVASVSAGPTPVAQNLLLRLHDLPLGYRSSGGSPEFTLPGCGAIEPAEPRPRLAAFIDRFSPAGCTTLYVRLFRVPGAGGPAPLAVGTGALEAGNVEGAEAGLAASRELLSHLLGDELPREVPPPETIGDATRLYRWEHGGLFEPDERSSSFLVWRSGTVVASIFVAGGSAAANDQAAIELAPRQQKRIEVRTLYTPAEADDSEVPLEDPALQVPVYWLGDTFTPGRGLPRLRLADTFSTTHPFPGEPLAGLLYTDHLSFNRAEMVELYLRTPRQWKALRATGGLPFGLRCPKPHALNLPSGHAVVYVGRYQRPRCSERGPKGYAAVIRFPGVVVTAERADTCEDCLRAFDSPYDSFKGMATIARSLEPRPVHPPAGSP